MSGVKRRSREPKKATVNAAELSAITAAELRVLAAAEEAETERSDEPQRARWPKVGIQEARSEATMRCREHVLTTSGGAETGASVCEVWRKSSSQHR